MHFSQCFLNFKTTKAMIEKMMSMLQCGPVGRQVTSKIPSGQFEKSNSLPLA
jgi:hypothetical protein